MPLPLYVKSSGGLFDGLSINLYWLSKYGGHLYIISICLSAIYLRRLKSFLLLSTPFLLYFLALSVATQSQNIGYRFQAPLFIFIFISLFLLAVEFFCSKNKFSRGLFRNSVLFLFCLSFLFLSVNSYKNFKKMSKYKDFNYINEFPLELNKIINKNVSENITVALTEAGRLAYWNQSDKIKIIDLVGLNTPYPAKNKITTEYLENINPEVLMFHHAGLIEISDFSEEKVFFKLENKMYILPLIKSSLLTNKVKIASAVSSEYLYIFFDKYDVYFVDYLEDKNFSHVYAIKKSLNISENFEQSLMSIFNKKEIKSYYDIKYN